MSYHVLLVMAILGLGCAIVYGFSAVSLNGYLHKALKRETEWQRLFESQVTLTNAYRDALMGLPRGVDSRETAGVFSGSTEKDERPRG